MSFLEHLEELRWHIIRSLVSIVIFSAACFFAKSIVFGTVILGPSKPDFITYRTLCQLARVLQIPDLCIDDLPFIIQSRRMTGQFTMHITSSLVLGLICSFPYAFWEMWRFVKPGLYAREIRATRGVTFYVAVLFFLGVLFGYFIVSPISVNFLSNYQVDASILNEFDIVSYVNTLSMIVLSCALLFQLPIAVYLLTRAGVVSSQFMKMYRKHAIVIILLLSAILTPPDPFSQIIIAFPLFFLYQGSIQIARWVEKKESKSEETEHP